LVLCLFENSKSTFAKFFSGRAAEGAVSLIKRGQQTNIFSGIQSLKALINALLPFNFASVAVLLNPKNRS